MSGWHVIERTVQTLVRLLEQRIELAGITGLSVQPITTASFDKISASSSPVISLLLYQVKENAECRNAPRRPGTGGQDFRQPLSLELGYLVTPWGSRSSDTITDDSIAALEEARLLGLVLQTFYDHAEVGTAELYDDPLVPVWHAGDSLQIILESLPIEDHYRIWDASELGYRLSLTYRVRVTYLNSEDIIIAPPVTDSTFMVKP